MHSEFEIVIGFYRLHLLRESASMLNLIRTLPVLTFFKTMRLA